MHDSIVNDTSGTQLNSSEVWKLMQSEKIIGCYIINIDWAFDKYKKMLMMMK